MFKKYLTLVLPNYQFDNAQLNSLLARADIKKENHKTFEKLLFRLFDLPVVQELPLAAITGLGDGLNTRKNYWLRADPVELTYDLAAVYCQDNEHLNINLISSDKLLTKIKSLLAQDKLKLHTPDSKRWYIESEQPILIQTQSLTSIFSKNIINSLPIGEHRTYWLKLQSELQMLLNAEQTDANFNSLWFWGAGQLPAEKITSKWQHVWTDEPLSKGLAILNQISQDQVDSLAASLEAIVTAGNYLFVLTKAEENFALILKEALLAHKIDKVIIKITSGYSFELTKKHLYYFWRTLQRFKKVTLSS